MTYDKPFRLRVLHALTDALKDITPTNGYVSDMADFDPGDGYDKARVFRGRAWFGETDPIPMISVLEGTSPSDEVADPPTTVPAGELDWNILVQGFVNDDPENPTDPAYVLMADIQRRLAVEVRRRRPDDPSEPDILGIGTRGVNRIYGLSFSAAVCRPADDVSARAYGWLVLTLRVFEDAGVPYE